MKKGILVCTLLVTAFLSGCGTPAKNVESDIADGVAIAADSPTVTAELTVTEEPNDNITESGESVQESVVSTAQDTSSAFSSSIEGKTIVIDAGHGINSYNKQEPIAPNSSETKIAFASGTSGKNQTEEQLTLEVSLKLQKALEDKGAIVHMTRTAHNSDMTNVDHAEFANDLNADISVKIHADGIDDSSVNGVSVLVPGTQYISDSNIISKSKEAGEYILSEFVKNTGAKNRGISVRNDLTGFNWTKVPIVLVEMGFMTNPTEDSLMESDDYQNKMVTGIVAGLELYFNEN